MTKLEALWIRYITDLLANSQYGRIQIRKVFQHQELTIPWDTFITGLSIDCKNLGYSSNKSKMNQLRRNYFPEEKIIQLREKFKDRIKSRGAKKSQSCFAVNMLNQEKKVTSMGQCIQTIAINYLEIEKQEFFYIDINYRSTEIVQKFLADLMFLQDIVFPVLLDEVDKNPKAIKFTFSCLYISAMFMPVVFQFIEPMKVLKILERSDEKFYSTVSAALEKWMKSKTNYTYRTRVISHKLFREYVYPNLTKEEKLLIKEKVKK